jgi:E3 ubiquitin-protein ligase RNF216
MTNSTCAKCESSFEIPEDANFFVCPIEECGFEACRNCGEAPHIGIPCGEEERAGATNARLRVEEAATAAMLRKCPSCLKVVIKSEGCNKITCACRTKWCYCCEKKIAGYEHFCKTPGCRHLDPPNTCGNQCPLYSDAKDDERRAREAALAEASRVETATIAETGNQLGGWGPIRSRRNPTVDVEGILRSPT